MRVRQNFQRPPRTGLADLQQQRRDAVLKRAEILSAMSTKAAAVKDSAELAAIEQAAHARPVTRYSAALAAAPLKRLSGEDQPISKVYAKLVEATLASMNDSCVTVAMTWPARDVSLSAVASLIAVADMGAQPEMAVTKGGIPYPSYERPRGLRALLYPYARSTHKHARQVLLDKTYLRTLSIRHAVRHTDGNDTDGAMKDFHQVLARAGKLTGLGRNGKEYPEFRHPILDEIIPHGACNGTPHGNGQLLWRSSTKTDLKQHKRSGLADHGKTAEFFLHGLTRNDNPRRSLREAAALDVVFFDLTKTGQQRLGDDWPERAGEVFKLVRERQPKAGVVVLVDEPFSFDKCRFEIFNEQKPEKKRPRRPTRSVVVTAYGGAVLANDEVPSSWTGAVKVQAVGFGGAALDLAEKLRRIGSEVRSAEDKAGLRAVRDLVATLRRNASLPGSLSSFSDHVTSEQGPALANDFLTSYRVSGHVVSLKDPTLPAFQIGGAELADCLEAAQELFRKQQAETPMSLLLEKTLEATKNSSGRSLFMFQTQPLAEFAIERFTERFPWLRKKMERRMIVFAGQGGLSDIAGMPPALRNQFKKLYLVAPARNGVLSYFARPWLPEQVVVLADADTLRFSSRDALRLAGEIDEPAIGSRLRRYGLETAKTVQALGSHTVNLDGIQVVPDDVDFPRESVVDLTGGRALERERIEIKLADGPRVMAFPGSALVLHDQSNAVDEFREVVASAVSEGDRLCVLSAGFIEKARLVLNIPTTAAGEIRDYHALVMKKFAEIPGDNDSEKLRVIVDRINDPEVDLNRARYWVSIKKEMEARIDDVVPHAPQKVDLFLKFTAALGIGERMAREFWHWGVLAQRTTKLKAGMAFHDAYKGILVDPFAAMADNQRRKHEIRRLRLLAEDYVATVESVERVKP